MVEVGCQIGFVFLVVAASIGAGWGAVETAQFSQGLVVLWSGLGFYFSWRKFPQVDAKHTLLETEEKGDSTSTPPKRNLLFSGFVQNWRTFKHIQSKYKNSIRWFFLALVFAEAAANAFVTVAVIFLTEELGLETTEIGIFFLVALLAIMMGCRVGAMMTRWTNPNLSWRLSMFYMFVLSTLGALTLNRENAKPYSFIWGFVTCIGMGWYYQTQYLYMSFVTPHDQEAEMAGFFNYCRLILVWLPPLMFSLLVEANISQSIGVIVTGAFFLIGVCFVSVVTNWEEIVKEVREGSAHDELTELPAISVVDGEESEVPAVLPVEALNY